MHYHNKNYFQGGGKLKSQNPAPDNTVYSKRNAHLIPIFCGPPGGGGQKIHMLDYVNGGSTHAQFFSLKNLQPF